MHVHIHPKGLEWKFLFSCLSWNHNCTCLQYQVATPDANTVITALSQLDEVLQSEERSTQLAPHIDQLLILATLQYRLVLNTKMANPNVNKEECIKIYRSLTNCLMMVGNLR